MLSTLILPFQNKKNTHCVVLQDAEGLLFEFKLTFSDHTHINSVRCISCSPDGIVASGGTDESVNLVDLKSRAEVGTLSQHTGKLQFSTYILHIYYNSNCK